MGTQKYVPSQTLSRNVAPKLSIRCFLAKIAGAALALSFVVSLNAQDFAFTHYISFDAPTGIAKSVSTFPVAITSTLPSASPANIASRSAASRNGGFILTFVS